MSDYRKSKTVKWFYEAVRLNCWRDRRPGRDGEMEVKTVIETARETGSEEIDRKTVS